MWSGWWWRVCSERLWKTREDRNTRNLGSSSCRLICIWSHRSLSKWCLLRMRDLSMDSIMKYLKRQACCALSRLFWIIAYQYWAYDACVDYYIFRSSRPSQSIDAASWSYKRCANKFIFWLYWNYASNRGLYPKKWWISIHIDLIFNDIKYLRDSC